MLKFLARRKPIHFAGIRQVNVFRKITQKKQSVIFFNNMYIMEVSCRAVTARAQPLKMFSINRRQKEEQEL